MCLFGLTQYSTHHSTSTWKVESSQKESYDAIVRWQRNKNKEIKTWESLFTQLTGNSRGCSTIDLALYCIWELELSPHAYTLPSVVRAYAVWDEHCTLCICVIENGLMIDKSTQRSHKVSLPTLISGQPHWQNAVAPNPKTKMLS